MVSPINADTGDYTLHVRSSGTGHCTGCPGLTGGKLGYSSGWVHKNWVNLCIFPLFFFLLLINCFHQAHIHVRGFEIYLCWFSERRQTSAFCTASYLMQMHKWHDFLTLKNRQKNIKNQKNHNLCIPLHSTIVVSDVVQHKKKPEIIFLMNCATWFVVWNWLGSIKTGMKLWDFWGRGLIAEHGVFTPIMIMIYIHE